MADVTNGLSVVARLCWGAVVLLGALLLLALSAWQWQRADAKVLWLKQQASVSIRQDAWPDARQALQWHAGQTVKLAGRFDPECRVALDNQPALGQTGYQLHQLFRLDAGGQAILVNLGWLASDRQQGPAVPQALNEHEMVMGDLQKPARFFTAGGAEKLNDVWRVGRIDLQEWEQHCHVRLLPWIVRLSPQADFGYHRDWQPSARQQMGPEKHRAYAFQWLALAVTWCLCWWRLQHYVSRSRQRQKGSSRWVVLALLFSFTLPFVMGQLAYDRHWVGGGETNKGDLLSPPVELRAQFGAEQQASLTGRWWLSYVLPATCDAACVETLQTLPRLQATLGRERERVGLLLIRTEGHAEIRLPPLSSDVKVLSLTPRQLAATGLFQAEASPWLIMDPLGWVMLRYQPPTTHGESLLRAQLLLDDLKKLLKASRIG